MKNWVAKGVASDVNDFNARRYINEHKRVKHDGAFRTWKGPKEKNHICKKCNGGFSNKGSLLNHLCNKLKKESEEQKYQCPKCASVFSGHRFFITHHKKVSMVTVVEFRAKQAKGQLQKKSNHKIKALYNVFNTLHSPYNQI